MPNIKSAIKRLRSNAKKCAANQAALAELKTLNKNLLLLADEPKKAVTYAKRVISRLDQAVSRGVIPQGRADRKKSRIEAFLVRIQKKSKKG